MTKTSLTHDSGNAWIACRDCGIDFHTQARAHELSGDRLARRFGFCNLLHLARYVREIQKIVATDKEN